jgi:acyl-coenzyme A thioesterase PaaI-like protein
VSCSPLRGEPVTLIRSLRSLTGHGSIERAASMDDALPSDAMADHAVTADAVNDIVRTAFPGSRARCVELDERHAIAELVTDGDDVRPGGFIAGPVQFAVADAALWFLVFGALGRIEPMALTSELSIRYLRPAVGPAIHARADLASISRRSVVGSVTVWTSDRGKPTAIAQGTYALPRPS